MRKQYFTLNPSEGAIIKRDSDKYAGFLFPSLQTCKGFVFISDKFIIAVHHIGLPNFDSMLSELTRWNIQKEDKFGEIQRVQFFCNPNFPNNIKTADLQRLAEQLRIPFEKFSLIFTTQNNIVTNLKAGYAELKSEWIIENRQILFNHPQTLRSQLHRYSYRFLFYQDGSNTISVLIGSTKTFNTIPDEETLPDIIQTHMQLIKEGKVDALLSQCRQRKHTAVFDLDQGEQRARACLTQYFSFLTKLMKHYGVGVSALNAAIVTFKQCISITANSASLNASGSAPNIENKEGDNQAFKSLQT